MGTWFCRNCHREVRGLKFTACDKKAHYLTPVVTNDEPRPGLSLEAAHLLYDWSHAANKACGDIYNPQC
jgi:hypothetical protein